jgi:hypothetical protein
MVDGVTRKAIEAVRRIESARLIGGLARGPRGPVEIFVTWFWKRRLLPTVCHDRISSFSCF